MNEASTLDKPDGNRKVRVERTELSEAEMERLAQFFDGAIKIIDDLGLIPAVNRPTLEQSISSAGLTEKERQNVIASERAEIETQRKQHRESEAKRRESPAQKHLREAMSLFAEILVLVTSVKREGTRRSFRWLGRNTISIKAHEKIDFGGHGDGIVIHESASVGKKLMGAFRYDVGTGFDSLFRKQARNIRQRDQGYLKAVPNVNIEEIDFVGEMRSLPYVTIALGRQTLLHMADKFYTLKKVQGDTGAWEKAWAEVEYDPTQLLILNELEAQFKMHVDRGENAGNRYYLERAALEQRLSQLASHVGGETRALRKHWPSVLDSAYRVPQEAAAKARMVDLLRRVPSGSEVNNVMDELRRLALGHERAPRINEKMAHELRAIREIRLERIRILQEMNPAALDFQTKDPQYALLMKLTQGDTDYKELRDHLAALKNDDW